VSTLAELRPARVDDQEAIATLWQRGWREAHLMHSPAALVAHRRLVDFRARVPERIPTTTVATTSARVVGFVTVHDDEIEQLYVDESARGSGVAAALLTHGERVIAARYAVAWLGVVPANARARRFYERQGWHDIGAFDYEAQITDGTIPVPCRRYEKQVGNPQGK
jgi:ribosomal protein S18 acetylase RimI-like enzyme